MKKASVTAVALLLLAGAAARSEDRDAEGGAAKLVGNYLITAGQEGQKKIPAEEVKGNVVRISDDIIAVYDRDQKEVYTATYRLETDKKPWVIHMTSKVAPIKGVESKGLIQMDGDTVRLIYALPGGTAPDDFKPEDKQQLFIMKKRTKK